MKTLRLSSIFPSTPGHIWTLLMRVETLQYIAAPWAAFTQVSGEPVWQEGARVRFRLRIFGLPLGIHTIDIRRIDPAAHIIQTFEGNRMVPVWNHRITLTPVDGACTRYTDELVIGAGLLSGAVHFWAWTFYRHRQRKWLKLLANPERSKSGTGRGDGFPADP
jgi:ligand-binding SRPBCC domain-containing protein